jgi:hypothetical protein
MDWNLESRRMDWKADGWTGNGRQEDGQIFRRMDRYSGGWIDSQEDG